jgi:hypothetical protein
MHDGGNEGTRMGHLALHYRPGEETLARLLLEDIGCTLVDNGPEPGQDGFCTALFDDTEPTFCDNQIFLSALDATQVELEDALAEQLGLFTDGQHPAATAWFEKRRRRAEVFAHFGIRYGSMEQLERTLADLERDSAPGGPLEGRVLVEKRVPAPGHSGAVDARIAASPAFEGDEPSGPAEHWVQCRFVTDVVGFGLLCMGSEFELDYVFEDFFATPASFAPAKPR